MSNQFHFGEIQETGGRQRRLFVIARLKGVKIPPKEKKKKSREEIRKKGNKIV